MKFGSVIPHLAERGFASRKLWKGLSVVFFGTDDTSWLTTVHRDFKRFWHPTLADMGADDWFKLPHFWKGAKDDFLPFDLNDPKLKRLRAAKEKAMAGKRCPR